MNPRINQLVRTLLKKDTLDQCSLPELQEFADRHPYFGAAQLLLTKKMQAGDPEQYNEQLQKTFLFFHNPLWVEHLLNDNGKADIVPAKKEDPPALIETKAAAPVPIESIEEKPAGELQAIAEVKAPEPPVIAIKEEAPATEVQATASTGITELVKPSETEIPAHTPVAGPAPAPKEELLFEPFHTVDYFASQGIRFKEEEKPTDKFGQQLKSFTQWLKTMKRLPVAEIAKTTEPAAEKKVEEMAEHSLKERDVVTEAMAEVWEKQGNTIKAIEIYSKLSLLEPAKSTYFAAKIEELKKLN